MDIEDKTKADIVEQIADLLTEKYIFPEMGQQIASQLRRAIEECAPFLTLPPVEFAHVLTQDYLSIVKDTHLQLDYAPDRAVGGDNTEELMKRHSERMRRYNFEFSKIERLAGNIGYLSIHGFPPPEVAGQVAAGAMAFVANTQALIFDIRGNGGGTPEMVQLLISYLVGDAPQPLSGIYSRATGQTKIFQTLPELSGTRMPEVPVYVLVNKQTHSAAEAFAYDLQALKRATIVGERTRGGAHLVDFIPFQDTFVLMLPVARAVNPITGGNWQGSGVRPDVEVPAEGALWVAHQQALHELLESASEVDEKEFLQAELESLH